jgi:hypothetical protein
MTALQRLMVQRVTARIWCFTMMYLSSPQPYFQLQQQRRPERSSLYLILNSHLQSRLYPKDMEIPRVVKVTKSLHPDSRQSVCCYIVFYTIFLHLTRRLDNFLVQQKELERFPSNGFVSNKRHSLVYLSI